MAAQDRDDKLTPAEWRARLEARPLPDTGEPPPWEQGSDEEAYGAAAESLAHCLLVLVDERPELLDVPGPEEDPSGFEAAHNQRLWEAFEARWPDGDRWLGGPTGFQYGWVQRAYAHNIVRYIAGVEPVGNPALVTVKDPGER